MKEILKSNSLIEEIEGSFQLISSGLKSLNDPDLFWKSNSVPIHLLSFGFERFLKSIILMYVHVEEGDYPELRPKKNYFRNNGKNGHQMSDFFNTIVASMESQKYFLEIPLVKSGFSDLKSCPQFLYFIEIMDSYSQFNRFFYIDMITSDDLSTYFETDKNPYKKFQRFLYEFHTRDEAVDGIVHTRNEREIALKKFTFLLFNHLRTLSFNFSHGFNGNFKAYSHGFQIFTTNTNEQLFDKLITNN